MSEVGALIIRLQAETAQFRADMGKVKGDLNELKGGSQEAGEAMDFSMREARGGLMLTDEVLGVHIPRHLNALIAEIPGVGAAFAAMLPLVGVFAAVKIIGELINKHSEMKDHAEATRTAYTEFAGGAASSLRGLQDELLKAGIKSDELRGDHLAALQKELKLIDDQKLDKLISEFDKLAQHADKVFTDMRAQESFFQIGSGAHEAQTALKEFKDTYDLAMAQGDTKGAQKAMDDFADKVKSSQAAMKAANEELLRANEMAASAGNIQLSTDDSDAAKEEAKAWGIAADVLKYYGQEKKLVNQITNADKSDAVTKGTLKGLSEEASLQKIVTAGTDAHAAAVRKLTQTQAELKLAQDKGTHEESDEESLSKSLNAIDDERVAAIAAADQILQSKKTLYDAELKAAGQNATKKKELDAQYVNEVRAHDDAIAQADAEADKKSEQARAAIRAENLRASVAEAQAEADGVLAAAIKGAQAQEKAAVQAAKNQEALHKKTAQQTADAEVTASKAEVAAEVQGYNDRIKALDKYAKDYEKKVQELQNKIREIEKKGGADQDRIVVDAEQKKTLAIQQAEERLAQSIGANIGRSIVMNQSLAQSFRQTGAQMLEGMIKNLIVMELMHDKTKLIQAKNAFDWAMGNVPFPLNLVVAPAMFAQTMAFEQGGKIPGQGAVPIIGHGGETVVTRALTDRVEAAEGKGGRSGGDTHMHNTFAPHIHALDSEGVDRVLAKHGAVFQKHITTQIRRMNGVGR
jgi:hypothetical protein